MSDNNTSLMNSTTTYTNFCPSSPAQLRAATSVAAILDSELAP